MVWFPMLGDVIFLIGLVVAIILFAIKKKWFIIMYLISICVYIFTIGFVVDVFDFSKDQTLLILAFSSAVMIGAGVYLSKERKPVTVKTRKMNMKVLLGVLLPFLIIVGVIIFSVWSMRVSHTIGKDQTISKEFTEGTCPYVCAAGVCLFQDGVQVAVLNSGINEEAMAAIKYVRVGHDLQAFDNLKLIIDDVTYVDEDFSKGVGCFDTGSVSHEHYATAETDNNCALGASYDLSHSEWAVIIDSLAGNNKANLLLGSSTAIGANWAYQEAYQAYLDDGNGHRDYFSVSDITETHEMTLCGNPLLS